MAGMGHQYSTCHINGWRHNPTRGRRESILKAVNAP
jgi:hypothetical protein